MAGATTIPEAGACPYEFGAPIDLAELLALPPDGRRYTRDAEGRLALMSPDDFDLHGGPLVLLVRHLHGCLGRGTWVFQERAIAFDRVWHLRGSLLRPSFLGPKALEPDVALFDRWPATVRGPHGLSFASAEGLRVVMEVLSPSTWRSDLGLGSADEVDRARTYLEAGVAEYWQLNPAVDDPACPVSPRAIRVLARDAAGAAWQELPAEGGLVASRALPALRIDPQAYWAECGL